MPTRPVGTSGVLGSLALGLALAAAACTSGARAAAPPARSAAGDERQPAPRDTTHAGLPTTRPERSKYEETSRYADVVAFLDSLRLRDSTLDLRSFGVSEEGRRLPLVLFGAGIEATPAQIRADPRIRVVILANIHAGEVCGFDTQLHQRLSGADVQEGDTVRVRFEGYRFGEAVLTKAMVSREADGEQGSRSGGEQE